MSDTEETDITLPRSSASSKVCPQCGTRYADEVLFCSKDGSTLSRPGASDLVGQIVADRYRILEPLGEGAMGRVYLAQHVKMGRRCAIKVMNRALISDHEAIGRFNREATNASRVLHPNVAAIYDFGETSDGLIYLAMEVVEGEPLSRICERERMLPVERAVDIARQIAEGLTAAHELGIVHRDLKPANVVVAQSRDGRDVVKIVDFGIAKGVEGEHQEVTRTGFVVGTPEYMSPEQLAGGPLDGRSDLFALGCILYKMLTGETSFSGTSIESRIQKRLTGSAPRARTVNPAVPAWLDDVAAMAMDRDPDQRFRSAAEMRDALTLGAASTSMRRRAMQIQFPSISRRLWFGAGVAAGVTVLVSLGMSLHRAEEQSGKSASVPPAASTQSSTPGATAAPSSAVTASAATGTAGAARSAAPGATGGGSVGDAAGGAGAVPPPAAPAPAAPRAAPARTGSAHADSLAAAVQLHLLDAQRNALEARQRAIAAGATTQELQPGDSQMERASGGIAARRFAEAITAMASAQRSFEDASQAAATRTSAARQRAAASSSSTAVAARQPPAAAPATPPPATPAAPADPAPLIDGILARYASALASRDIDRVRAAYPGITAEEAKRWSDVFDATTSVGATLAPSGPLRVSGATATVTVTATYDFAYKHGVDGDKHPSATYQASFAHDATGWHLTSLR